MRSDALAEKDGHIAQLKKQLEVPPPTPTLSSAGKLTLYVTALTSTHSSFSVLHRFCSFVLLSPALGNVALSVDAQQKYSCRASSVLRQHYCQQRKRCGGALPAPPPRHRVFLRISLASFAEFIGAAGSERCAIPLRGPGPRAAPPDDDPSSSGSAQVVPVV